MGFSNQGTFIPFRSSGRGFAAVDPERQREIDLDHARAIARRHEAVAQGIYRPSTSGWLAPPRDPADEGGSVRRSR